MIEPGWWVTQVTTLLVAAMGAGILRVKPRTTSGSALAGLLISYSLGALGFNVARELDGGPLVVAVAVAVTLLYLGLIVASARLLQNFPQRLRRDQRRVIWTFALLVGVSAVGPIPYFFPAGWFAEATVSDTIVQGMSLVGPPGLVAVFAVAIGLAHRYQQLEPTPQDDPARRQMILMAAGLVIPTVFNIGTNFLTPEVGVGALLGTIILASGMVAWLSAARVERGGRDARAVAWLIGLVALTAVAMRATGFDANQSGAYGVARVVAFAILAYGLLRAQLLGIDVKLRFAISKSTIAAVFIAAFFVASEAAQQFFGATFESAYVGIAAAGMLVFAMAPLQRAAERLAEKAVPSASHPEREVEPRRERAYRHALELAWRDRSLTAEERVKLAHLAQELGLSPVRAAEIEADVAKEGIPSA